MPLAFMQEDFLVYIESTQRRIQHFPDSEGEANLKGTRTWCLSNFSRKMHGNEEILVERGRASLTSLDPPMQLFYIPLNQKIDVFFLEPVRQNGHTGM